MRKQLRFRWTEGVTTTAGHVATSLIPTDTFTRDFINKTIGRRCIGIIELLICRQRMMGTFVCYTRVHYDNRLMATICHGRHKEWWLL
jgi:hypothetical protein